MQKKIFIIFFILIIAHIKNYGQFPYNNDFSTASDFTFPLFSGNNATIITTAGNTKGLSLTTNSNNLLGTAILDKVFSSANGIKIEFDYVIYGTGTDGADGLTFYLFDGSTTLNTFGTSGASLGYTYRRTSASQNLGIQGLTDAYIGLALDVFGNFKQRRNQGSPADYVNGISSTFNNTNGKSHITIRGAAGKSTNVNVVPGTDGPTGETKLSNYLYGYPVLYTRSTKNSNPSASVSHMVLNPSNGNFTERSNVLSRDIDLASSSVTDVKTIILEIVRNPNVSVGGSLITVKLKDSVGESIIINKFSYPLLVNYIENHYNNIPSTLTTLTANIPASFKMGFTGATGGLSNSHLIKNLKVTVPYTAEPANDNITVCANGIRTVNVTGNDLAYSGTITAGESGTNPTALASNIDRASFSFVNSSGQNVGYSMTTSRGTYNYDPLTGNVTYIPLATLTSGEEEITYSIKGSVAGYNTNDHRGTAKIKSTITGNAGTITGSNTIIRGQTSAYTNSTSGTSTPWSSSNTNIFTVNNSGVVTAVNLGTAYLYYATSSGCIAVKTINVVLDTDGDGVHDGIDLDSDNDGILDYVEITSCSSPTFKNVLYTQDFGYSSVNEIKFTNLNGSLGTSELTYSSTNPTSDGHYSLTTNSTLVDDFGSGYKDQWSAVMNSSNNANLANGYYDHTTDATGNGFMAIFNPQNSTSAIWQSPNINVKRGAGIEVSLWLMRLNFGNNNPNLTIQLFDAANNTPIGTSLNTGQFNNRFVWEEKKITIPVGINTSATSVYVKITSQVDSGQGNDFALDDIAISELYCDSDGDLIPNYLDLDSDNDGCPDAIEGGDNVKQNEVNAQGRIRVGSNGGVGNATNNMGVPNLVNPNGYADSDGFIGQTVGNSTNSAVSFCTTVDARNDNFTNPSINNTTGGIVGNVIKNDYYNQNLQNATTDTNIINTFNFTLTNNGTLTGAVLNSNGDISIPNGITPGVYTLTYLVCTKGTPSACDTATIIIEVYKDSDGDGISDVVDLDDDNDGILDTVESAACTTVATTYYFQNFGTGSRTNLSSFSPTMTTNYVYEPNTYTSTNVDSNLNDGEFAVVPNLNNLAAWSSNPADPIYGNAWVTSEDHTPNDTNGRMAVFNASRSFNENFFTVANIGPAVPQNKILKISFWAKNLDKSPANMNAYWGSDRSLPSIKVNILNSSTTIIHAFTTGTIPRDEEWHEYTAYFNTGTNTTIGLSLFNIMEGGNGNDVAIDDITITSICDTDNDGIPNHLDTDSDGDGCADAMEGSELVTRYQIHSLNLPSTDPNYAYRGQIKVTYDGTSVNTPANIISTSALGYGVPQLVNNAGNNLHATTNPSDLKGEADAVDSSSEVGQESTSAYNSAVQSDTCKFCYKPAQTTGVTLNTNVGISTLEKDNNWPQNRKGAFLAIESKTKGLVLPRTVPSSITTPELGMVIYDTSVNCIKMYTRNNLGLLGWYCLETQTCDDPL